MQPTRDLGSALLVAALSAASGCGVAPGEGAGVRALAASDPPRGASQRAAWAGSDKPLRLPLRDPRIVVLKSERTLRLYAGDDLVREYPIGLGGNPDVDKRVEGDRATPTGDFYVFVKNPKSAYYLSLGLSYPNAGDAERGLREGLVDAREHRAILDAIARRQMPPQKTALGGEIYIHGRGSQTDWTLGCVALDDDAMKELFDATPVGTPVRIEP